MTINELTRLYIKISKNEASEAEKEAFEVGLNNNMMDRQFILKVIKQQDNKEEGVE